SRGGPKTSGPANCIAPYPILFTLTEVPGSVKVPPSFVCFVIVFSYSTFRSLYSLRFCQLKALSHKFFALLPKRLSAIRVERVSPHSLAHGRNDRIIGNDVSDVAVLAILSADLLGWRYHTRPHRSRGSLRNGFELEGSFTLRRKLRIHLVHKLLQLI